MYAPPYFRAQANELAPFIHAHGFATLVGASGNQCHASHIPLLLDEENHALIGHLARANPHWQQLRENPTALAIFHGPHAYVSAGWYHSPSVPTWNYAAVHVRGEVEIFEDLESLRAIVDDLSSKYEEPVGAPWDGEFAATMLRGIVGLRIRITSMSGKFKLSQNRPAADRESVIRQLMQPGPSEAERLALMMSAHDATKSDGG